MTSPTTWTVAEYMPVVATISLVLDQDLVLIGGGVAQAGTAFWQPLRRTVQTETLQTPNLRPATLCVDSALRGAMELARCATMISSGTGCTGESAPG